MMKRMSLFDKKLSAACLVAFAIFASAGVVGYLASSQLLTSSMIDQLQQMLSPLRGLGSLQLFFFVFFNNTIKALFAMAGGLMLGLFPVIFLFLNGLIIGVVGALVSAERGPLFFVMGILPHGVFEIPAILLASGLGLRIAWELFVWMSGKPSALKMVLLRSGLVYLLVIVPALLVAALVEVFVTSRLVG